jgi:hypothetical protein
MVAENEEYKDNRSKEEKNSTKMKKRKVRMSQVHLVLEIHRGKIIAKKSQARNKDTIDLERHLENLEELYQDMTDKYKLKDIKSELMILLDQQKDNNMKLKEMIEIIWVY